MKFFTNEEILIIHRKLIHRYGGITGFDTHTLEVCLLQPFQTYNGMELYLNDLHKICLMAYLIIKKHPFTDGNKRVGMLLLILGLRQNGYRFNLSNSEVVELGVKLADNSWGINELMQIVEKEQEG